MSDLYNMEKIICSAVKVNGEVFRGHRHCHAILAMNDKLSWNMGRQEIARLNTEQGFVTSENRFVDRSEAIKIAIEAKQIDECKSNNPELFSEDLY